MRFMRGAIVVAVLAVALPGRALCGGDAAAPQSPFEYTPLDIKQYPFDLHALQTPEPGFAAINRSPVLRDTIEQPWALPDVMTFGDSALRFDAGRTAAVPSTTTGEDDKRNHVSTPNRKRNSSTPPGFVGFTLTAPTQ